MTTRAACHRFQATLAVLAGAALGAMSPVPAATQPAATQEEACVGLHDAVHMQMLLEKTIFSVDVLWLSVRIDGSVAGPLGDLGRRERTEERGDSVATLAVDARCATARLDFVRDVSLDRFLGAIRESTRAARKADFIGEEIFRTIDGNLADWYAFLEGRGVADGDRMTYRIRGDTLNIRFRTAEGELLLDRTDVGEAAARSVLAGYMAPGSDFREGLIRSLFDGTARGGQEESAEPDSLEAGLRGSQRRGGADLERLRR